MPALRRQNYPSQKQLQSGSRHRPSRSCGHWITCQTDAQVRVRIFIMCHIGKRGARSGQEATKHCPIPIILFHVIRYVRAVKATVNFLGPSFIPVLGDVLSEKLGYFLGIFIVPFAFYHLEEEQSCFKDTHLRNLWSLGPPSSPPQCLKILQQVSFFNKLKISEFSCKKSTLESTFVI